MNKSKQMLVEAMKNNLHIESNLIIEEDEDVLVGTLSKDDVNELFDKELYIEFNGEGFTGKLIDMYKSGATRIVIELEDGEFEDRELHEVTHYEVL